VTDDYSFALLLLLLLLLLDCVILLTTTTTTTTRSESIKRAIKVYKRSDREIIKKLLLLNLINFPFRTIKFASSRSCKIAIKAIATA